MGEVLDMGYGMMGEVGRVMDWLFIVLREGGG